jgi:hypothetical protein
MKVYQLHYKGKNRAKITFKTEQEAERYQKRLISYIKDRILEGQLGYKQYLKEAQNLELFTLNITTNIFSIVEYCGPYTGIIKNYKTKADAERNLKILQQDSNRDFTIMESKVNA